MWLSFAGIIGLKTSPPALKGPLARDETAVPTPRRVIPDGCNLGVLLRALDGFASGLSDALHGSGIRLLIVRPGFVIGRMTAGMAPAD